MFLSGDGTCGVAALVEDAEDAAAACNDGDDDAATEEFFLEGDDDEMVLCERLMRNETPPRDNGPPFTLDIVFVSAFCRLRYARHVCWRM